MMKWIKWGSSWKEVKPNFGAKDKEGIVKPGFKSYTSLKNGKVKVIEKI